MNARVLLTIVASLTIPTHAASLSEAFTQGTTFGRTGNAAARGQITGDTARSAVPSFTTTTPETSYFGSTSLGAPAAARAGACIRTSTDPACKAVEFSQTNPSRRPAFSITATDPLLTGAQAIIADPHRIAGNLAGTYSGCTTRTSTTPDIFETHFCNEYRILERQTCEKTLSVTVTDNGLNCSPGALITPNPRIVFIRPYVFVGALCADEIKFQWTYGYSECNGTDASIFVTTTVPTDAPLRMPINLGCGGEYFLEGSCPDGNCNYRVGTPEYCDEWCGGRCCESYRPEDVLATFSFARPKRTYTITDSWINRCAAYEARLP